MPRPWRRWTARDDERLRMMWGERSVEEIAAKLDRTPLTTYWRARKLGLPCGCPQGFEYMTHAAKRSGFPIATLRKLLKRRGVSVHRAMSRPRPESVTRPTHYVCPDDVDAAIAAWNETETVRCAARRHGIGDETLRRWLLDAGHAKPRKLTHWRLPSDEIDRVVAMMRGKASVAAHARRIGLHEVTLARRLRKAGVLGPKRPGVTVLLTDEDVDAALAGAKGRAA